MVVGVPKSDNDNRSNEALLKAELLSQRQQYALDQRMKRDKQELDILKSYHSTSISQSRVSFWVGIVSGIVAFGFILWTTFTLIQSGASVVSDAIKYVPEVIGLAFSTILLRQAKQARELMSNFLGGLRIDRTMEEILELARTIDDEEIRSKVKGLLALASKASRDLEDAKNAKAADVWTKLLQNTELLRTVLTSNDTGPGEKAQKPKNQEKSLRDNES
jgi:hypothetical protein